MLRLFVFNSLTLNLSMRLSEEKRNFIKEHVKVLDSNAQVFLFGSRTDDHKKGGDIDLLIVSPVSWDLLMKNKFEKAFHKTFGEQKIDIVHKLPNEKNAFIEYISEQAIAL
jgi:predicted nucleotidyltransferase